LTLVDAVPNEREHFLYKILCSRLRLAGFQLTGLSKTFCYCEETISKWSKVLHKGDSREIAKVFGLTGSGKITPEIKSYIKRRYIFFKLNSEYAYRKKILAELADYFDLKVTGEGIRPLFREADVEFNKSEGIRKHNDKALSTENGAINIDEVQQVSSSVSDTSNIIFKPEDKAGCPEVEIQSCTTVLQPVSTLYDAVEKPNSTCSSDVFFKAEPHKLTSDSVHCVKVIKEPGLPISGNKPPYSEKLIRHLGLILLLPLIDNLTRSLSAGRDICRQILGQFLLGALNLEQSKTISKDFFRFFFDDYTSNIQSLRTGVYNLATLKYRIVLGAVNMTNFIYSPIRKIFYYDPHTKKYTGCLKLLAGYCGSLHQTGKILVSDYIHDTAGKPCFVEHYDNMYDLRVRFFFTVEIFKKLFPQNLREGFTWIIDRGIYGIDTLNEIAKSKDHIITWEKDYKKGNWNDQYKKKSFILRLSRNNSSDLNEYTCEYYEQAWHRNSKFRNFIVRVTKKIGKKKKRTIEVSVLCSDSEINSDEAVQYILRRWLQENDFAYLIKHYGIDQIDSYKYHQYRDLEDKEKTHDFLTKSREFKDLQKQKSKLKIEYKKSLINREKKLDSSERSFTKKINARKEKESVIAGEIADIKEINTQTIDKNIIKKLNGLIRKLDRHKTRTKRIADSDNQKKDELKLILNSEVDKFKIDINGIENKINSSVKDESRLNALIKEKYYRLDTASKSILDLIRIMARNSFYEILIQDFRPFYDNLRDDHVVLRSIIQAPGKMKTVNGRLFVELFPEADFPKKTINAIKAFMTAGEEKINVHFSGKAMPITLSVNL
jgi:hypothetical protein